MPTNNGFVKIHRKMLDNPVVCKDNDYFRVWLYLLLNASHKGYSAIFNGKKIELKAGQLITGRKSIAEKCNISESKAQRILKSFEIEQQIEQQTGNKNRLITVLNWDKYQNSEQQIEQQVNIKRTSNEQQVNTNKNVKNDKKVKNVNNKAAPLVSPPFSGIILDKVNEWLQYKKERKQSYKSTGLSVLFRQIQSEIDKHGEDFVISVIDKSIMNNWNGLFFDNSKQTDTSSDDYFLRVARGEINI